MINHSDFLEAIKFYGEIGIGQIGFQVIAVSLGRRASGEWKAQDSVRFMMMIYNSIQGIILCYLPFYLVSLLRIKFPDLVYYLIAFSTFLISLYSCYLIYIYNKVRKFPDFTSGGALTTVYSLTFIVNILMLLSLFHAIQPDIWLYYLSIHFYQAWSLYGFVRLMIFRWWKHFVSNKRLIILIRNSHPFLAATKSCSTSIPYSFFPPDAFGPVM